MTESGATGEMPMAELLGDNVIAKLSSLAMQPEDETPEATPATDAPEAKPDGAAEEEKVEADPKAEDEKLQEDTPGEEKKEEVVPAIFAVPEGLKEVFPDVKDEAGFIDSVKAIKTALDEETQANSEMVELLLKNSALIDILREVQAGKPLYEAIRGALEIPEEKSIPDPKDDPEAYREFVRDQIKREEAKKLQEVDQKKREALIAKAREGSIVMQKDFQTKHKMSDQEMTQFLSQVKRLVYGDPDTLALPADYLERMYKAVNYEKDVTEASKKGTVAGRNEAIDKLAKGKTVPGDGLPQLRSGVKKEVKIIDELTPMEERLAPKPSMFDNI